MGLRVELRPQKVFTVTSTNPGASPSGPQVEQGVIIAPNLQGGQED